jgi:hypothetical protein
VDVRREEAAYSLCSSRDLSATAGYIQYRVGSPRQVVFRFPARERHPKGALECTASPNGDAAIGFRNGGYAYGLLDPLRGMSSIAVTKTPGARTVAGISCGNPNQSLQLNYTIKLMDSAGIAKP